MLRDLPSAPILKFAVNAAPSPMRPIRAVAVLPTLFTLGNLVCGFFAIVVASRIGRAEPGVGGPSPALQSAGDLLASTHPPQILMLCGMLIFLGMLFDTFDGQVARITRSTSDFGGQLDSLCDVVTFGVAPAFLLVKMCPQFTSLHREFIWGVAALFVCCAAMRLARFNVETDETDDHTSFSGLPSPAAAAVIASFAMLSYRIRNELRFEKFQDFDNWLQWVLPPFALLLALLMVSRIPYPHMITLMLRGQKSFAQVVATLCVGLVVLALWSYAVPLLFGAYAAAPAMLFGWRHRGRWRAILHGDAEEDADDEGDEGDSEIQDVHRIG